MSTLNKAALAVTPVTGQSVEQQNQEIKYKPDQITCAYRTIQGFSRFAMNMFFGDIDIVGIENIPAEGPVILVGNHKNQFVDAMMVGSVVKTRKVAFLTAEKSMHRRFVGDVAKRMEAIPVIRPQDRARSSPGVITGYDPSRLRLLGSIECSFTTNVKKGEMIILHGMKSVAPIVIQEVLSDTSVIVKMPLKPEDEADGSGGHPAVLNFPAQGVTFKVIPKIDQREVFKKVHDALCEGRCIGIFPEGGSSDRADLLPLKVGVAIMALGAVVRGAPVQIIPFGINYSEGNKWRSKVLVDIGKPLTVPANILDRYRMGAAKEAQAELLKQIETALRAVTFNAPDKHTLNILRTMRRLYQGEVKLPVRRFMELNRRFALAFSKFRDDDRFLDLVARVHDYMQKVRTLGIVDRQVAALPPLGSFTVSAVEFVKTIFIIVFMILFFVSCLPGNLLFSPLLLRIRYVAQQEVRKALAGSSVKVKGVDVEASQKIMSAIIWAPVTVIVYTGIVAGLTIGLWPRTSPYPPDTVDDWFFVNAIWLIPLATPLTLVLTAIYNIYVFDYAFQLFKWLPYHFLIIASMCRPNSAGSRIRLRRKELSLRIQEFFDKIILPAFPEWAEDTIISRETLIKKRRKSDYHRAIEVAQEIDEIAKEVNMPDSPSLPNSRKTISELKNSMMKMGDNVGRFEVAQPLISPTAGAAKIRYERQVSFGLATNDEEVTDKV
jgi:glycerol-3-phosphate O-acyltransferase/dihydroxyacetone phosphate acyltransferase